MKTKVAETQDYLIQYEDFSGLTFIHCTIKTQWNKKVKEDLNRDFEILKVLHGGLIFAFHEINDTKHEKFLRMFGFKHIKDVIGLDGVQRQLFVTGNNYGY